ncbi:MAG: YggS family pyridoxal phosphate-dependent enzyme [Thermosynechococcaceae cyanobacterium]
MTDSVDGQTLAERIAAISQQLPPQTRLIAITKTVAAPLIRQAYAAGIRDFGESRIQELESKCQELADLSDIRWHFIGHLQRNKAKRVVELCAWIHSVDSLALARRLNQVVADVPHPPKLCLQVKIVEDPHKYGWSVAELTADLPELLQYKNLDIQGLMTILPLGLNETQMLTTFRQTCSLAKQLTAETNGALQLRDLSMGMSGDYQWAAQAGATMIRLGRTLFGERQTPA